MMARRSYLGWTLGLGLMCGGVMACSSADESSAPLSSSEEELSARGRCSSSKQCADDDYCKGEVGQCPSRKSLGRCAHSPSACTKIYAPVCGCDGVTYGKGCTAAAAGVSVESNGECAPKGQFCGGIAGFPCPAGEDCVDDPSDDCDPNAGGADCGGICVAGARFCGGIAGIPCPEGEECADDPNDGCDPKAGGADCGGICQPALTPCATVRCSAGHHCIVTPKGTAACVADDPCAVTLCPQGTFCVADGDQARCEKNEPCGEVICPTGTTCCNPLRNICTKPGVFCIQ